MTDTYKLIDLFQSSKCKHWFRDNADMMELASYLVENGTTVQTTTLVNSIQDDFCGVPCDFMEDIIDSQAKIIKRQSSEIERLTNKCDDCAGCTQWKCDCLNIEIQAYEKFAEEYKDQIKNYTGMFTDFGFMVNLEAVLNAVDFIRDKLVGENNDNL